MHFWFVHSGEVSIREQIVTQITLGVLSGELAPGERLPSTRELARRFHLHANTVSTAYQQLESDGWVESRRGSGVFVRGQRPVAPLTSHSPSQALNHIFSRFLNSARKLDIPDTQVKDLLRRWLETPTTTRFLFIEPREPLREIIVAEIQQALDLPVSACGSGDPTLKDLLVGAIPLALPSKAATVRSLLPAGTELITLQVRSAASSLAENLPVPSMAGIPGDGASHAHRRRLCARGAAVLRHCNERMARPNPRGCRCRLRCVYSGSPACDGSCCYFSGIGRCCD
jgi:GntR family transcriptional regulator